MCKCGGMPQDFEIFERGRDKPCVVVVAPFAIKGRQRAKIRPMRGCYGKG